MSMYTNDGDIQRQTWEDRVQNNLRLNPVPILAWGWTKFELPNYKFKHTFSLCPLQLLIYDYITHDLYSLPHTKLG